MHGPLRVYLEFEGADSFYRSEWGKLFCPEFMRQQSELLVVDCPTDADCVLKTVAGQKSLSSIEGLRSLTWDAGDSPDGRDPGLYCSLPKQLFDPRRHRTFCYPITYNECVETYPVEDAENLFSFYGGVTSGLRSRIVRWMQDDPRASAGKLTVRSGPWDAMFDRSGLSTKKEYAESLRRSKFVLCPRGNGVGSVRMFEVMRAGRVPVILSDDYVFPSGIDWSGCSVRVREKDLRKIPNVLGELLPQWESMALNALRVSRERFEGPGLLKNLTENIRHILSNDCGQSLTHRMKLAQRNAGSRAKHLIGRMRRWSGRAFRT
jgi:hypothetical protein